MLKTRCGTQTIWKNLIFLTFKLFPETQYFLGVPRSIVRCIGTSEIIGVWSPHLKMKQPSVRIKGRGSEIPGVASSRCLTHCSLASITIFINGKCSFQIISLRITSIHIMEILIQCHLKRILELRYINKTESHTHNASLYSFPNLKPWSLSNNMYSFYSTIPQILSIF